MQEPARAAELTQLLHQWRDGSQDALERLVPLVYDELHTLASRHLSREWRHDRPQATTIYYWAGRHDRAIAALTSVLQVEPDFAMARNILGLTYLKTGRLDEAIAELEAANRLATGPRMLSTLAYGYGIAGSQAQARSVIESLRRLSKERYTSAFALGIAYAGLGDRDGAIAQLEQAFAERSDSMVILRVYPVLDILHGDARFQNLVRQIGFPGSP